MWECVFHDYTLYFTNYTEATVLISEGWKDIGNGTIETFECPNVNINGCVKIGYSYYRSVEGSNEIIYVDSWNEEKRIPVLPYDAVQIRNTAKSLFDDLVYWSTNRLVVEGRKGGERELFVVSVLDFSPQCVLPIRTGYIDFIQTGEHTGRLLCDESRVVLPDWPETRRLLYAELEWSEEGGQARIVRSISVDRSRPEPELLCDPSLRIPLYGSYLKKRPVQKSFVTCNKRPGINFVAYYAEELQCLIVGNPTDGTVHKIIALPEDLANSSFDYYYYYLDTAVGVLGVVPRAEDGHGYKYFVDYSPIYSVGALNRASKKLLAENLPLSELPAASREKYNQILKRAAESCTLKLQKQITLPEVLPAPVQSKRVTLTVKTPISGTVAVGQPLRELGSIDCEQGEFEHTFLFDTSEERFTLQFQAKTCTKELSLWRPFDGRTLQVDMSVYLRDDEIAPCCDRAAVRKKLQAGPADPYAIYRLGRVGSEGDLNYLLALLQDKFMPSGRLEEPDGERIWNIVNAVFHLSVKYRRSDAAPLFRSITESPSWNRLFLLRTVQRIDCCRGFLEKQKGFHSYPYRVDLRVRTRLDTQICLASKDNLVAEIDGGLDPDEGVNRCYLRGDTSKFSLILKTAYREEEIPIDVQNNDDRYRQEITVKPPAFTREMAKKVLKEGEYGVLAIPDGFEVLEDDFAYLLEKKTPDYDENVLYEIHIPASVTTAGALYFADDAIESFWDSSFDKIVVAEENPAFCSIDGVLFTKDKKRLICYPCGKQGTDYTVPDGVVALGEHSFKGNQFLERICLPSSLKVIEKQVFLGCKNLEQVTLPDGLEFIGENAFALCHIHRLTLPGSLRKIHWTNLSGGLTDIGNLEIPDAPIEIDMSGHKKSAEKGFMPPLFLLNGENPAFEKYARRHRRNLIKGFSVDEAGIVWADDGKILVAFPLRWPCETYQVPDNVTKVFRWAFNGCDIKCVVASKKLNLIGTPPVRGDLSKIDPQSKRYDPNFLVSDSTAGKIWFSEQFGGINQKLDENNQIGKATYETVTDTNRKVTSLVHFVENDLQTWLEQNRPRVEDEDRIEQFAKKAVAYIDEQIRASNQDVEEEETHLQGIFGGTWDRLLPETQSSLISAGVLWKLCANISAERFDYSGIVIEATSALESELKRVFFTDFQQFMVEKYGDPTKQDANKTYADWPENLLNQTEAQYNKERKKGPALPPSLSDYFTLGNLPHLFSDKNDKNCRKRMGEYLSTVVRKEYRKAPVKAFTYTANADSFVSQCENIRKRYRNPAGHTATLDRKSAEDCYTMVVGKVESFRRISEVQGLIMTLYGYLK
ncbi:MAG: leucine-rich repeat domain-containing protein [Clostridiales bacterium]|nr:leucine-rich repeat domain-containing protein [Clostridiales bacterium]